MSIRRWWKRHKWVDTDLFYVLPRYMTVFWLNSKEEEAAKIFRSKTGDRCYQYCFTPGPIGVCTHIKSKDGKDEDITDYEAW